MPSEDWMTVSIRKASPQASGSEEAPGRAQWSVGDEHRYKVKNALFLSSNSRSTSIAMYIFNPNQHLYHFNMFLSVSSKHYALSL